MSEDGTDGEMRIEDSGASLKATKKAAKEGRNTLEHQIRTVTDIDDKAIRIYRANILLLSVVIGAMSLASEGPFSYFTNLNTILGLLLLVVAIALAGITYTSSDLEIGVTRGDIKDVVEDDYSSKDLYFRLASGYGDWIAENDTVLQENADLMIYTIIVQIWALAYLSGGIIVTAVVNVEAYSPALYILVICLCFAGLLWNKIWLLQSWSIRGYIKSIGAIFSVSFLVTILAFPELLQAHLQLWTATSSSVRRIIIDGLIAGLILCIYPFAGYSIYNLEY